MKCPQCNEEMEKYEGRILGGGKPEMLWYCKTHGTWCMWSIKDTRKKQKYIKKLEDAGCDYCSES